MKNRLSLRKVMTFTIVAGAFLLGSVGQANAVIISATERGAYRGDTNAFGTGGSGTSTGNYLTGVIQSTEFRSFFNFDLSSTSGTITSATMTIALPFGCSSFNCTFTIETLGIFDFTSSIALLIAGTGGATAFTDLGGGVTYGSSTVSSSTSTGTMSIVFNAAGLTDLNAAIGGDFAVGGALTSLSGSLVDEFLFGASIDNALTLLDFQIATPVPEPSTLALFAFGLFGLGFVTRRRKNRRRQN